MSSNAPGRNRNRFSKLPASLVHPTASRTDTSSPAASVKETLSTLDANLVPTKVQNGLKVTKITRKGVFKARVVIVSLDQFMIFVAPAKLIHNRGGTLIKAGRNLWAASRQTFSHKTCDDVRNIDIADVDCIQMGYVGTVKSGQVKDGKRATQLKNDSAGIVSIIHHGKESLDMIFTDPADAKMFVVAVKSIKAAYRVAASRVGIEELMLRYIWYHVDLNHDGLIDLKELGKILKIINFSLKSGLRQRYDAFVAKTPGVNGTKGLTFGQCMKFLHELKLANEDNEGKLVSDQIWDDIFGENVQKVGTKVFLQKFLYGKQKEDGATIRDVEAVFSSLNSMELGWNSHDGWAGDKISASRLTSSMDRARFEAYLKSEMNDIYDPDTQKLDVEALNKPLTSYWINTSHNTYLTGDQLQSTSSVGMYAAALRRGCKCIELDCWDGGSTNGEPVPVVYHGFTMTSKIEFKDVVTTVEFYVKENPNTYPIILSLENHCSKPFQIVMADVLRTKLKGCLFVYSESEYASRDENAPLPSPEQLKGKVLIKGKRPPEPDDQPDEDSDDEVGESDTKPDLDKKKNLEKIVPELAELTLFHGDKYQDFTKSIKNPPSHMHSISEPKITKILSKNPKNAKLWTRYNVNHMTRTYPAGARVDSSNYNPILAWGVGCQMVALNFQTSDNPMILNDGRFRQNGGCGYVPKPESLTGLEDKGEEEPESERDPTKLMMTSLLGGCMCLPELESLMGFEDFDDEKKEREPMKLKIRILQGSCLPKPKGVLNGEVIDSYVKVIVYDMSEADNDEGAEDLRKKKNLSAFHSMSMAAGKAATMATSAAEQACGSANFEKRNFLSLSTKVHRTDIIHNNGFCPAWLEPYFTEFKVHNPDVAMVQFSVRDEDFGDSDDKVAEAAIPVSCLRRGYRCVRLHDLNGSRSGPFGFALLLVEIDY